ncbi:mechanosensitive ion channel [Hyphobacterium sp. CCMP332]|nr:mechanosensitive ion channel [Hyphobacterium sp. CCMP332]
MEEIEVPSVLEKIQLKVNSWLEGLIEMLPNLFVAILIVLLFYIIGKFLRSAFKRLFQKLSNNVVVINLFANIFYMAIIIMGFLIALNVLHLEQTVTSILAGAGILGIALGLAFQDISTNFISGIIMAFRKPIKVGDIIETERFIGQVEEINLRVTIIKTFQGLHVLIPNKDVFQAAVTNYTKTNERRVDLEIGVSYAEDLEKVKNIAIEAIEALNIKLRDTDVGVYYNKFDNSSINFTLMFWIHYPDQQGFLDAQSKAIIAIKKAFDKDGITIPFPIRTLDFGIKGGLQIGEVDQINVANKTKQ